MGLFGFGKKTPEKKQDEVTNNNEEVQKILRLQNLVKEANETIEEQLLSMGKDPIEFRKQMKWEKTYKTNCEALENHQLEMDKIELAITDRVDAVSADVLASNPNASVDMIKQAQQADMQLKELNEKHIELKKVGEDLEKKVGESILAADAIYLAMDTCWNQDYPLIEPECGIAYISSSQEAADEWVQEEATTEHYYLSVKKIEHTEIESTLAKLKAMGIKLLMIVEAKVTVYVDIDNIISIPQKDVIESYNADILCLMIGARQLKALIQKHGEALTDQEKEDRKNLSDVCFSISSENLFYSVLYIPMRGSEKVYEQFKSKYLYSPEADANLSTLMKKGKIENRPELFKEWHSNYMKMPLKKGAPLPFHTMPLNTAKGENALAQYAIPAYTNRQDALERASSEPNSIVIGMGMEELISQISLLNPKLSESGFKAEIAGLVIDPETIMTVLPKEYLEALLNAIKSSKESVN